MSLLCLANGPAMGNTKRRAVFGLLFGREECLGPRDRRKGCVGMSAGWSKNLCGESVSKRRGGCPAGVLSGSSCMRQDCGPRPTSIVAKLKEGQSASPPVRQSASPPVKLESGAFAVARAFPLSLFPSFHSCGSRQASSGLAPGGCGMAAGAPRSATGVGFDSVFAGASGLRRAAAGNSEQVVNHFRRGSPCIFDSTLFFKTLTVTEKTKFL